MVFDGTNCVCDEGFSESEGVCYALAEGMAFVSARLIECPPGCSVCSSLTSCSSCEDGYFLEGTSCLKCHSSCLTCSGAAATQCTDCPSQSFLQSNNTCVSCSLGEFGTVCDSTGIIACIKGYYPNSGSCDQCPTNCV